jgi:S1-C subfamily serine protease
MLASAATFLILQSGSAHAESAVSPAGTPVADVLEQIEREYRASVEKLRPALVSVTVELRPQPQQPPAELRLSGTILDNRGRVAIPPGGLEQAANIRVTTHDGRVYLADRILNHPAVPLAIIELQGKDFPAAPVFAPRSSVHAGDCAIVLSNSFGFEGSAAFGFVSGEKRHAAALRDVDLLQTTVDAARGMPGGIVGNRKGEVVAILLGGTELDTGELAQYTTITTRVSTGDPLQKLGADANESVLKGADARPGAEENAKVQSELTRVRVRPLREPGVSLALPIHGVLDFLAQAQIPARAVRDTDPPRVGILLTAQVNALARKQLRIPDNQGLVVEEVYEGTPAARAGLSRFDIILRAGGDAVSTFDDFAKKAIEGTKTGTLELDLYREGKLMKVTVRLGPRDAGVK